MQQVSQLFNSIISGNYSVEYKAVINNVTYGENVLRGISVSNKLFSDDVPMVGCAVSGQVDIKMKMPAETIPRMAKIELYARVTDGTRQSEWIRKGIFFIDTRSVTHNGNGLDILTLHGYDSMLKAEDSYPSDSASNYPASDLYVVNKIAEKMGITVDSRTSLAMELNYQIQLPVSYTMRETLCNIASMYAGNFIISDAGELRLVTLNSIGRETNLLLDNAGFAIVFGSDRILV